MDSDPELLVMQMIGHVVLFKLKVRYSVLRNIPLTMTLDKIAVIGPITSKVAVIS